MGQEDQSLLEQESNLDKAYSDLSLQIRRLLSDRAAPQSTKETKSDIKLPNMNVHTFDGNIVNWNNFWQQFNVAVHSKTQMDDTEKLVYLRDALKDGPARHSMESLTHDSECYKEAIDCLQKCYDQPHIIRWAHTHTILNAPPLKDGNRKELQRLHDIRKQHLHELKVMRCETFATFATSILELKLDQAMLFEWQWHTQSSKTVPDYDDLLEFLDLCVRAADNAVWEGERKRQVPPPERKAIKRQSYAALLQPA